MDRRSSTERAVPGRVRLRCRIQWRCAMLSKPEFVVVGSGGLVDHIGGVPSTDEQSTATACRAPALNLYFFANGDVGPCCRNRSYGNIAETSLQDIWSGVQRRSLRERLARREYPDGCGLCAVEHRLEGERNSFTAQFDALDDGSQVVDLPQWPVRMEFELSNRCNLQCVQCNGELSSAIRSRREHRSPMARQYGDHFFEELAEFIPHLDTATFLGGEPFLSPECYRIWELVAEAAPDLRCVVVTNGTQWNDRVAAVLERLRIAPYVSLDGITAQTYESIRVGASFHDVVQNLERFRSAAEKAGTVLSIVFCVMPQNLHELPDLLLFAEERAMAVTTSVVREPVHHSAAHMTPNKLLEVLEQFESRDRELTDHLVRNRAVWDAELDRLRGWTRSAAAGDSWAAASPSLLMFERAGSKPVEVAAVRSELAGRGLDTQELVVRSDGRVAGGSRVGSLLGLEQADLDGSSLAVLQTVITRFEVVVQEENRYEADFELESGRGRLIAVPERDSSGWADSLRVFVAVEPVGATGVP